MYVCPVNVYVRISDKSVLSVCLCVHMTLKASRSVCVRTCVLLM